MVRSPGPSLGCCHETHLRITFSTASFLTTHNKSNENLRSLYLVDTKTCYSKHCSIILVCACFIIIKINRIWLPINLTFVTRSRETSHLSKIFNFEFSTFRQLKNANFDANPVIIGYLVTELWAMYQGWKQYETKEFVLFPSWYLKNNICDIRLISFDTYVKAAKLQYW